MELKAYEQIPLRILITNKCNGVCYFCHAEGISNQNERDMDLATFQQIIMAARELRIKRMVLSGGEPTLAAKLEQMLHITREIYPAVMVSITTNGANLCSLLKKDIAFDKLNLSISSFHEQIYSKYQRINPFPVLNMLSDRKLNTNVNIVVTKDNYRELEYIIEYCIDRHISVKLLFELRNYCSEELTWQISFIKNIENKYGDFFWNIDNIPELRNNITENKYISIKHPYFNQYFTWSFCSKCNKKEHCFERLCAVRIDENRNVFPCLNRNENMTGSNIKNNIQKCYSMLDRVEMTKDIKVFPSLKEVLFSKPKCDFL